MIRLLHTKAIRFNVFIKSLWSVFDNSCKRPPSHNLSADTGSRQGVAA